MPPITPINNAMNSKIYRRWHSISLLPGQDGFVATKFKPGGKLVQLIITNNGKKRELLSNDSKIVDTIGNDGVKRTYTYLREGNNVKGQMFTQKNPPRPPFILAAKWIAHNCVPQRLLVKLNPEHKAAEIFVKTDKPAPANEDMPMKKIKVKEFLAKDFVDVYTPAPKTIILKTNKGDTEVIIAKDSKERIELTTQFGINSDVLGWKIRAMV